MALVARRNGDSATTEFVQHASDDKLERYAVKTLTEPEAGPLMEHPVVCQLCRERLDMLRSRDRRPNLSSGNLLQIESSDDDCRPDRIHILSGFFGGVDAIRAYPKVLLKRCEFGFVLRQSKVEPFKIVVGNVGRKGGEMH
jgi:hypothetical protein